MSKYDLIYSKEFSKDFKKLSTQDKLATKEILKRLANDEILEPKFKDHQLKGELKAYRECHIKPNLLLIYEKRDRVLELTALRVGSHSSLFKK